MLKVCLEYACASCRGRNSTIDRRSKRAVRRSCSIRRDRTRRLEVCSDRVNDPLLRGKTLGLIKSLIHFPKLHVLRKGRLVVEDRAGISGHLGLNFGNGKLIVAAALCLSSQDVLGVHKSCVLSVLGGKLGIA